MGIGGRLTVNHAEKEGVVTLEFFRTAREVFLRTEKNSEELEIVFPVVPVVLKEVQPRFVEDKSA